MSSLEIAELTEKRRDLVMRDIRVMLDAIGATGSSFGSNYRASTGRTLPCFQLPFDETMALVAGYDAALRFKIVRRWRELEPVKPAIPNSPNPAEAPSAWAERSEQVQLAQAKVVQRQQVAKVGELASSLGHRVRAERRQAHQRPRVRPGYATTLQPLAGVPAQTSGAQMGIEGWPFRRSFRTVFAHPRLPAGDVRPGSHETTGREDG